MLIEKSWKVDDICTVKMTSGEEIITKITAADENTITMNKPLSVQISVDPNTGRMGMQLMPGFALTVTVDAKLKVSLSHVLFITLTEDSVKKSYLSMTSSLSIPAGGIPSKFA